MTRPKYPPYRETGVAIRLSHCVSCGIAKIQTGAHKRGLKPQIFRENRGQILPGKSGLFGANWGLFRADRGLFGADRDQFLRTPQPRGKSRNCPERALFGPIGAFRAKPPFAKPPFGFPVSEVESFCSTQICPQYCWEFHDQL